MTATLNRKPITNPAARLRLLRRWADLLAWDEAYIPTAVMRLAERGLATTERYLAEYVEFRQTLRDLDDGTRRIADLVDVDAYYSSAWEIEQHFRGQHERQIRHLERLMAGA